MVSSLGRSIGGAVLSPGTSITFTPIRFISARLRTKAKSSAVINGQKITIDYGAPSLHGRKILGDLIPIGTVWRTGDGAATTLKAPIDLKINDLYVSAGTDTVYSIVTKKGYQLIINKQTGQSGAEYNQSSDLGRPCSIPMIPMGQSNSL
jgi:hypothetical protein